MARADWGDENGSTVTFKLPMAHSEDVRNPFHAFTKRRKGKSGTRFMMACQTASEDVRHALYEDEAMLAGWNDSQQNGHTVKLWLCNDGMGHPFEGVSRTQALVVSLTELDDDNTVVDPKMRDRVEKQIDTGRQKLSNVAALLCRTEEFWDFCTEDNVQSGSPLLMGNKVTSEDDAKQWMYLQLGIRSRAELDTAQQAAQLFHDKIRKPYEEWFAETIGSMC